MDRGLYKPPHLLISYPFRINIIYLKRFYFRQYLIGNFGEDFSKIVIEAPHLIILPVVIYGVE